MDGLNHSVIVGKCPSCLVYEERVAAMAAALNQRGYHLPKLCSSDNPPCYYCEPALSDTQTGTAGEGCTCDGPPMQPCGPKCKYPYTDERAEAAERDVETLQGDVARAESELARVGEEYQAAEEKLAHLEGKASDNDCPYLADKIRAERDVRQATEMLASVRAPLFGDWNRRVADLRKRYPPAVTNVEEGGE